MDDMVNKRIAVIPARGGSKRIPKKNVIDFMGKPMISWSIEAALDSGLFDSVLVSTDCQDIADIALKYGADVPFLRSEYADDFSTVSQATRSALKQLKKVNGKNYDTVVQLMANCPIRSSANIISQVKQYEESEGDFSLLSAFEYGMFNPWWAHYKNKKNEFEKILKNYDDKTRSQDLPELICPSGATWISNIKKLNKTGTFYSQGYKFHKISWLEAVDIDDIDDLQLAKAAYMIKNEKL
jgi:N-acylneuraminate cytidylyltransferase